MNKQKDFATMFFGYSDAYPANAVYLSNGYEAGKQFLQWRLPGTAECEKRPVKSGEVAAFCRKQGLKLVRNLYGPGWLVIANTGRQQFEFKLWYDAAPSLRTEWDAHAAAYEIARQERRVEACRQSLTYREEQVEGARRSLAQEAAKLDCMRSTA